MIKIIAKFARTRRVAQLAQRLGFDLPNAFAGHTELAADLLERSLTSIFEAEPKLQNPTFAAGQGVEDVVHLLLEHLARGHVRGAERGFVRHEVAEVAVVLRADGNLERDGFE